MLMITIVVYNTTNWIIYYRTYGSTAKSINTCERVSNFTLGERYCNNQTNNFEKRKGEQDTFFQTNGAILCDSEPITSIQNAKSNYKLIISLSISLFRFSISYFRCSVYFVIHFYSLMF